MKLYFRVLFTILLWLAFSSAAVAEPKEQPVPDRPFEFTTEGIVLTSLGGIIVVIFGVYVSNINEKLKKAASADCLTIQEKLTSIQNDLTEVEHRLNDTENVTTTLVTSEQLHFLQESIRQLSNQNIALTTRAEERYISQSQINERLESFVKREVGNLGNRFDLKMDNLRQEQVDVQKQLRESLDAQKLLVKEVHEMAITLKLVAQTISYVEQRYFPGMRDEQK